MFEKIKTKSVEFMQKHPKLTSAAVGAGVTVGGTLALLPSENAIGAFAEGAGNASFNLDTVADSLVTTAQGAYNTGITKSMPVIGMVMGFTIVLRLIRRFVRA